MDDVARVYDGYDIGVRYADHHVGQVLDQLDALGLLDDTAVMVSSDHGENLGELGIYCDHQTADQFTTRLPVVLRWPGLDPTALPVQDGLHYQIDVMATVLELSGATVPETWDGTVVRPGPDLRTAERASPPGAVPRRLDGPAVGPVRELAVHGDLLGRLPRVSRGHAVRPGRRSLRAA